MATSGDDAVRDWEAVRAQSDIQFAPVELPKPKPYEPGWLDRLIEWLGDLFAPAAQALAGVWSVVFWVLVAAGIALLAYILWRLISPQFLERRRREKAEAAAEWAPDRAEALALLEDADRLAAEGRFDEATHLLLKRSVGQIAAVRPDWLDPSSTAREIAALPALPERARQAFSTIAIRVERSLFALRSLKAEDWQAARGAYADFALADLRIAA